MRARIKMRSASVEDLGNIVKQMIDGVLEDNDQVAKLHQAVFEEYYSKKLEDLKQVRAGTNADQKLNPEAENSSPKVMKSPKSEENNPDSQILEQKTISDELDAPVVRHVIRRQRYIKVPIRETVNVNQSTIALSAPNDNTTMDLTQTKNNSVVPNLKSTEEIGKDQRTLSNPKMIEWRNTSFQKKETNANSPSEKTKEIPFHLKSKGDIAFENWITEKNNTYRRIFKEEQRRKRLEKDTKSKEFEKKQAANEAYLYWRRQQDARQRMSNKRKRIFAEMETQKLQSNERRSANSQAFKAWKRQKDIKLREQKMFMMAYGQQNYPQQKQKPEKLKPKVNVTFNMWLDQLDSVLHQKYLRERRYLVHSFYCQPAYFGTAALCRS